MERKPGDWVCDTCGVINFAKRTTCYKCHASRRSQSEPMIVDDDDHASRPPVVVAKSGDWTCPKCNNMVFASKNKCFKCKTPRPMAGNVPNYGNAPAYGNAPGNVPTYGNAPNFGNASAYGNAPGNAPTYGNASNYGNAPTYGNATSVGNTPAVKPGDWTCPNCNELVFASKRNCYKCKSPRPSLVNTQPVGSSNLNASTNAPSFGNSSRFGNAPVAKPGDWTCPNCNELVFAQKRICYKCKTPRPSLVTTQPQNFPQPGTNAPQNFPQPGTNVPQNFPQPGTNAPQNIPQPVTNAPQPEADEDGMCVVCMDQKAQVAITVCGHMVLCQDCSTLVNTCPMCRVSFNSSQVIRIFQC